ncbi:MAG: ABC transporter ATP-binding protein [Thermodesulfovibrionales bacterium]|jgi:iron complex transport system ATP-binding protein
MHIATRNIGFSYNGRQVLNNISLSFPRGEVATLLGPNGSGKTTLLKLILGILRPGTGEVFLEGTPISSLAPRELARRVAYVPQTHRGSFPYSVFDLALMGRMPHASFFSRYTKRDREIVMDCLERLGISHLRDKSCTEISGGQRQLALIARAMVQGADTFIMDEPTNGLDYGNQINLLERISSFAAKGMTFIITTHHPDHALQISDRVVMIKDGRVVAEGRPEKIITGKILKALYSVDVRVVTLEGGVRVCVPGGETQDPLFAQGAA